MLYSSTQQPHMLCLLSVTKASALYTISQLARFDNETYSKQWLPICGFFEKLETVSRPPLSFSLVRSLSPYRLSTFLTSPFKKYDSVYKREPIWYFNMSITYSHGLFQQTSTVLSRAFQRKLGRQENISRDTIIWLMDAIEKSGNSTILIEFTFCCQTCYFN